MCANSEPMADEPVLSACQELDAQDRFDPATEPSAIENSIGVEDDAGFGGASSILGRESLESIPLP